MQNLSLTVKLRNENLTGVYKEILVPEIPQLTQILQQHLGDWADAVSEVSIVKVSQ